MEGTAAASAAMRAESFGSGASAADRLARANPGLAVLGPGDPRLARYGRIAELPGLAALAQAAAPRIPSNLEANAYTASDPELEAHPAAAAFGPVFGFQPLQVGWNAGPNTRLNGLEWHASPEVLVAVTDLALLLGRVEDIDGDSPGGPAYPSDLVECLFLPAGSALEIFPGTMHLAPCRLSDRGFKSLVVLPRGTNEILSEEEKAAAAKRAAAGDLRARLLFMRNKWILAHPERKVLVDKGAWPGITGPNVEVRY